MIEHALKIICKANPIIRNALKWSDTLCNTHIATFAVKFL